MFRAAPAAAVLALTLTLTGCGASDDDKAADAVAQSLMEEKTSSFEVTQEEADCVGKGFVDKVGTDRLTEYGILTKDLKAAPDSDVKMSQQDADAAAGVMVDCTDAAKLVKDTMLSGGGTDPAVEKCLDDVVTEDNVEGFIASIFAGDQEAARQDLLTPMQECMAG